MEAFFYDVIKVSKKKDFTFQFHNDDNFKKNQKSFCD